MLTPEDMDLNDIKDQADVVGYLTPRELAKLVGVAPQMIYYHLRQGTLKDERCRCGRRIIEVAPALETLQEKARQSGRVMVDTRSDSLRQGATVQDMQEASEVEGS